MPSDIHCYALRENDNGDGRLISLEQNVLVNFGGEFITKDEVDFLCFAPNEFAAYNIIDAYYDDTDTDDDLLDFYFER